MIDHMTHHMTDPVTHHMTGHMMCHVTDHLTFGLRKENGNLSTGRNVKNKPSHKSSQPPSHWTTHMGWAMVRMQ
jgi:hypothetical protein